MILELDMQGVSVPNAGGQLAFCDDWEHEHVALEGGWGSGKTWAGARKLLALHLHNAFDDNGDPTYVPSVVVAPTYSNAADYDVPALLAACDEAGLTAIYRGNAATLGTRGQLSGPALVLPELGTTDNPSVILIRTADVPKRITGWEVGAAWGDEAARWKVDWNDPREDAYVQLTGRVRGDWVRLNQLMFTYTNEGDATRIYREFHAGYASHALYRAHTKENTVVRGFYDKQRLILPPHLQKQYLDGEAISLAGTHIYGYFKHALHVDSTLTLDKTKPLHFSIDFNIAPGMHGELGQYDAKTDQFICVHEFYEPGLDARSMVLRCFAHWIGEQGGFKFPELHIFGDATGGGRWAGTGESCYTIIRQALDEIGVKYHMRVPKGNPPVVDRVNAVNVALLDMSGKVHYKVHPRCERLIQDFMEMRRDASGGVDKKELELSHAVSAEGYRVDYLRPARIRALQTGNRFNVSSPQSMRSDSPHIGMSRG